MAVENTNYREIIPNQSAFRRWKDIKVNTGTAQSTLQDISLPESAGGFGYRESNRVDSVTRHRFIYWKINHDVLELVEQSLDYNLHGNQVRFRFQDIPVLDGVSIHETNNNVIVLVATVFSVHRFIFTHPNKLQRHDFLHSDRSWPSIFADASIPTTHPSGIHGFQLTNNSSVIPRSAASWMTPDGVAVFAVASNLDKIAVVTMPASESQGTTTVHELRQTSIMKRLWTGIIPASIRGMPDLGDSTVSVVIHPLDHEIFVFALCKDSKLRMWSCRDYECVMMADVLELINESATNYRKLQGSQSHILRKSLGSTSSCLYLGLYLCLANSRQICVVQPVNEVGQYHLELITTVSVPEYHLVDFNLTMTQIWALWITGENETLLNVTAINVGDEDLTWAPVVLESSWDRDFDFTSGLMDPREAYMQKIFAPGKFSVQTITKAISIYRRAADAPFIADVNVPINVLQEEVTAVVEKEIRMQASQYEMTDGEYLQLQLECWSKFFSCCVQYQEVESKIMGLAVDHTTGLVCLIKKSQFSLIRLQDPVETWYLSQGSPLLEKNVSCLTAISEDSALWPDLIAISKCLSLIDSQLDEEVKEAFECDLLHQHSPNDIIPAIVNSLLAPGNSMALFLSELAYITTSVSNVVPVIEVLLSSIDLAHGQPEDLAFDNGVTRETFHHNLCSHLFASDAGCSLVAKSVHQMAKIRFDMCRNLMFYIHLLYRISEPAMITPAIIKKLQSELVFQTGILLRTYHALLWASQTPASQVPRNTIEAGLCQLALLNITDVPSTPVPPKSEKNLSQTRSLVELFVRLDGGTQARCLLAQNQFLDNDATSSWSQMLMPLVQTVGQLLWPISAHFAFPEFLLVHCQYLQLSEYSRLLNGWCEWNSASRQFLLGHVALNLGEADKSVDWFLAASKGIRNEEFLRDKVLQQTEVADEGSSEMTTNYFLKVIHLLEQFGLPDHVITIANNALALVDKNDKNVSTLWSIAFKYHLELEHNQDAYAAISNNPDVSRKKDCLRQLVVVLCERHQYQTLVEFPYVELHEELVSILESRARSVDLTTHNYYDILYSYHVFRGDFRKASSVMYECGLRLGLEVPGLKGLQRQAKCYLTTLNCLRLVNPNYAWIVKPVTGTTESSGNQLPSTSPKRSYEGEEISQSSHRKLKVLELSAIEKEYDLLHARLQLYRKEPDMTNVSGLLSISETVGLLVTVGLFDAAIHLCRTFSLPYHPVFEGLTIRCIQLSKSTKSDDVITKAWDWLSENDLSEVNVGTKTSATDHAWALLRNYIKKLEAKGQSQYHRCVTTKLLTSTYSLPSWLLERYKIINPAELLCLYLDHDLLEEAAELVLDYIDAVLGRGKEYFGLANALLPNAPAVWVPYTLIDNLLVSLSEFEDDVVYNELLGKITHKMEEYESMLKIVSKDMVRLGDSRGKLAVDIVG